MGGAPVFGQIAGPCRFEPSYSPNRCSIRFYTQFARFQWSFRRSVRLYWQAMTYHFIKRCSLYWLTEFLAMHWLTWFIFQSNQSQKGRNVPIHEQRGNHASVSSPPQSSVHWKESLVVARFMGKRSGSSCTPAFCNFSHKMMVGFYRRNVRP